MNRFKKVKKITKSGMVKMNKQKNIANVMNELRMDINTIVQEKDDRINELENELKELADGMAISYIQNIELGRAWQEDEYHWECDLDRAQKIWKLLGRNPEKELKETRQYVKEEWGEEDEEA